MITISSDSDIYKTWRYRVFKRPIHFNFKISTINILKKIRLKDIKLNAFRVGTVFNYCVMKIFRRCFQLVWCKNTLIIIVQLLPVM